MVAFELQPLHVVSELDLLLSNVSDFISKSGVLDFEGFRSGGGTTLLRTQRVVPQPVCMSNA
jgi:hypothetical protein